MADISKIHNVATAEENLTIGRDSKIACTETTSIGIQIINQAASAGPSDSISPSSCCKRLETNELPCDVLQQKLQEFYKDMVLSKVAWLNEGCNLPIEDFFIELKLKESKNEIKIEEFFNKIRKDKKQSRIYIEGQPGYGKTTLANKLVNDWALQNKDYIKHFKLVFLLPLRELHGRTIQQTIISIGENCGLEKNQNAIEILNKHKNQTLFVLDGLDEIPEEERSLILKTLYKLEYSEVTVIVFSRTGLFSLTVPERASLFGGIDKSSDFHDRKISILGIKTRENKEIFLNRFFPLEQVYKILDSLKSNLKLFDSPLFLMLLTIIASEKKIIEAFTNQTEIYKRLFNFIIKHHFIKCGKDIKTNFDLFCINTEINDIQHLIQQFGEISLEKIINNHLQFECTDVTKQIYKAGFLINHKQMTYFRSENYYESFHLSFVEFASAYALWIDFKYNNPNLETLLKPQVLHFFATNGTSLVLIFLASLMEDDSDKFINQIKSFSFYFSSNFSLTANLFQEYTSINNWQEKSNIIDFLPSVIDLRDFSQPPNMCKDVISYGNKYGKIKSIIISEQTNPELIPSEISPNTQIVIEYTDNPIRIRYIKGHCKVKDIITKLIKTKNAPLRQQLHYIASSNVKSFVLCLHDTNNTQILETILSIQFKKIKYDYLTVKNDENEIQMIAKLVKNNQIEYLKVNNVNYSLNSELINEFTLAAAQSDYLTSIELREIDIDLYHLTNGGNKKYRYISLRRCGLSCSESLLEKNCCEHLEMYLFEVEGIIEIEPLNLTCSLFQLGYLLREYRNWSGFNNLVYLCLSQYCFNMKDVENLNVDIVSWNKLRTLFIEARGDIDVNAVVELIQMLPITNFGIYSDSHFPDKLLYLFERMNEFGVCLTLQVPSC